MDVNCNQHIFAACIPGHSVRRRKHHLNQDDKWDIMISHELKMNISLLVGEPLKLKTNKSLLDVEPLPSPPLPPSNLQLVSQTGRLNHILHKVRLAVFRVQKQHRPVQLNERGGVHMSVCVP